MRRIFVALAVVTFSVTASAQSLLPNVVQAVAQIPRYPGVITTPGGGLCTPNFTYDGGNEAPGTFITQACAQNAGIGTIGPGGVFIPPAGTPCEFINNGNSQVFVFPCVTVSATDIRGNTCFCKTTVYVVKNGGNYLNVDLLSRDWGRCVRAADYAEEGAVWPAVLVATALMETAAVTSDVAGTPVHRFSATVTGVGVGSSPAPTRQAPVRRIGALPYSFIPASLAGQLNLSLLGAVDLSQSERIALAYLELGGALSNGQSTFQVAYLPSLQFSVGTPRGGYVFVIDDANSNDIIVGGSDPVIMADFAHVIGATAATPDRLLVGDPQPRASLPWHVFAPTAAGTGAGLGDFRLHPTLPPQGFIEGATLISFDTRGLYGQGPIVGLYPDTTTLIPLALTATPGNLFRFTDAPNGTFPRAELYAPPGTLPIGVSVDAAMLYYTTTGFEATGAVRVTTF